MWLTQISNKMLPEFWSSERLYKFKFSDYLGNKKTRTYIGKYEA